MSCLNAVKVEMEGFNGLEVVVRIGTFCKLRFQGDVDVNSYLEVVLLLADKRLVRKCKIESFVCIDAIVQDDSAETRYDLLR